MNPELIACAREWLCDCYPDDTEEIAEASAEYIMRAVQRDYDGGLAQFIRDCQ